MRWDFFFWRQGLIFLFSAHQKISQIWNFFANFMKVLSFLLRPLEPFMKYDVSFVIFVLTAVTFLLLLLVPKLRNSVPGSGVIISLHTIFLQPLITSMMESVNCIFPNSKEYGYLRVFPEYQIKQFRKRKQKNIWLLIFIHWLVHPVGI